MQYLLDKGIEPEVIEYLKTPITEKEFEDLLVRLHRKPEAMVRTQESYYKSELRGKTFNDREWVKILLENPKLIRRPIVVRGAKAVVGDPAEEIATLL